MEAPFTVPELEEAVKVFYNSGAAEHAAAHEWLTRAQTSPQAWSFVWDLMTLDKVRITLAAFYRRRKPTAPAASRS